MTLAILMEPHDLLFCRDGRPIVAGAGAAAGTQFPTPQVLAGMIRTALLRTRGQLPADGGKPLQEHLDAVLAVGVRGPLPCDLSTGLPYIPCPADCVAAKKPKHGAVDDGPLRRLAPLDVNLSKRLGWDHGPEDAPQSRPLWGPPVHGADGTERNPDALAAWQNQGGWLTFAGFQAWQRGDTPTRNHHRMNEDLWSVETRTQVGLDPATTTASDGILFTSHYLRLNHNIGLYAEVIGADDLLDEGPLITHLGGDRRRITVTKVSQVDWGPRTGSTACALTPALLEPGRRCPECWVDTCIGMAIPGHLSLSGWDLAANNGKGAPRPCRHACLPGSTWHLDNPTDQPVAIGTETSNGFGWLAWGTQPTRA